MKKILVIGANGQLGNCFRKIAGDYDKKFEFVFAGSSDLDITHRDAVLNFIDDCRPQFCINASAYTAVDKAESETEKAFAVNALGVQYIAEACAELKAVFVHISTDYVFDGDVNISYSEDNFTNPQGVYGASKLKGEELALETNPQTLIVRTSWLYSEFNSNFVKTMLRLFKEKDELKVVADQFGQPTNATDLAVAVMEMIQAERKIFGIFHFANYPETTWFDFACKIAERSHSDIKILPVTTAEYPTAAIRPQRSTLCLDKIEQFYHIEANHWEHSLEDCLDILKTS